MGCAVGGLNQPLVALRRSKKAPRAEVRGGAASPTRDPGVRWRRGGPHGRRGREVRTSEEGGGGRGAPHPARPARPAPPPRPARTPLAPARADGTRRHRPLRGRSQPLAGPRIHGRRPAGRGGCVPCPTSAPPPCVPAAAPGGGWHLPAVPPHPSGPLAPRPYQLGGEPGRPSGIGKSRRWEVLGEGGTGLKGTTTSFQPRGEVGAGGAGWGQAHSCSAVEGRKRTRSL